MAFTTEVALPVIAPYRLDLTVAVLRRFSTNVVDVFAGDGSYCRAFEGAAGPSVVRVRQRQPGQLDVAVDAPPGEEERACALAGCSGAIAT